MKKKALIIGFGGLTLDSNLFRESLPDYERIIINNLDEFFDGMNEEYISDVAIYVFREPKIYGRDNNYFVYQDLDYLDLIPKTILGQFLSDRQYIHFANNLKTYSVCDIQTSVGYDYNAECEEKIVLFEKDSECSFKHLNDPITDEKIIKPKEFKITL